MPPAPPDRFDVVVIGAGAAGLVAAGFAAGAGTRVLLVERTRTGGKKIVASGGGRCNVLPSAAHPERFVTASSPNTLRNVLASWPLAAQRRFFEAMLGVPLALEPETGKLFPASNRAQDVRDALVAWATQQGATLWFDAHVTDLRPTGERAQASPAPDARSPAVRDADAAAGQGETTGRPGGEEGPARMGGGTGSVGGGAGDAMNGVSTAPGDGVASKASAAEAARWRVELASGRAVEARAVVVATGGLSVPASGSDGAGLRWAARLGHALHPTYAALTPLTATPAVHAVLSGLSFPATVVAGAGKSVRTSTGGFLFTHRGYSGPAVLDVSHLVTTALRDGQSPPPVTVRWRPDLDAAAWDGLLRGAGSTAGTVVRKHLPQRLADVVLDAAAVPAETPLAQLRKDARARLVARLAAFPLPVAGSEGYRTAEVTGGGVALSEVHAATLESRRAPGLFFCGEVLDAFGPIGGYNFLWAWTTGRLAGLGAAQRVLPQNRGPSR